MSMPNARSNDRIGASFDTGTARTVASRYRASNEVSLDQTECRVTFEYNVTKLPDTGVVQKTRMSQGEGDKENKAVSLNKFLVVCIKIKKY